MGPALGGFEETPRFVRIEEADLLAPGLRGALALGGPESCAGGVAIKDLLFDGELKGAA
jgi:hypothetical protein